MERVGTVGGRKWGGGRSGEVGEAVVVCRLQRGLTRRTTEY